MTFKNSVEASLSLIYEAAKNVNDQQSKALLARAVLHLKEQQHRFDEVPAEVQDARPFD